MTPSKFVTVCLVLLAACASAPAAVVVKHVPLTKILLDVDDMPLDMVKEIAREQAHQQWGMDQGPLYKSTPEVNPNPNKVSDDVIFEGSIVAGPNLRLAVFSDDGCDVFINGVRVLNNFKVGQHLPNIDPPAKGSTNYSFHPLNFVFVPGHAYHIRVHYSNTVFTGATDIDGITVFVMGQAAVPTVTITGANGEGTKKWIVATLPTPNQPPNPNKFSAKQSVVKNGPAVLKYKRGKAAPAEVPAQKGMKIALKFVNGVLNYSVQLFDGAQKTPEMTLADNTITVAGVQQGDKVFVEDTQARVQDRVAVVKNFTWNDYQRNGGKLTFAAPYDGLPKDFRDNLTKTIAYALDPSKDSTQAKDRKALEKELAAKYPGKGYCSLAIPSSFGVGTLPWDFDHGHLASSAAPPAAFVKKAIAFVEFEVQTGTRLNIVGGAASPPGKALTSFITEADRKKYLDFLRTVEGRYAAFLKDGWALTEPFVVYHTLEFENYEYNNKLKNEDPLKQIRTNKGGKPHLYSSVGSKNNARVVTNKWYDMPNTTNICNIEFVVNKRQEIILMPFAAGFPLAGNNVADADVVLATIFPPGYPATVLKSAETSAIVALEASVMVEDALGD